MVESIDKAVADREKPFVPDHLRVLVFAVSKWREENDNQESAASDSEE